jgi:hypothetical protein
MEKIAVKRKHKVSEKNLRTFEEVKADLDAMFKKHKGFIYQFEKP